MNLIDTPGLCDTRGKAWDDKILKMIRDLTGTLQSIDCVMMTLKASDSRLETQHKFVYRQLHEV